MHPQSTTSPVAASIPADVRAQLARSLPRVPCKPLSAPVFGAFLYARRSKAGQASIERQWRYQEQYAYKLQVPLLDRSKDEKSGLRLDRSGLQYMLGRARARTFSHLILHMYDRLSREDRDFLNICYQLFDLGIKVYCTYEGEITRDNAADLAAKAKRRVIEDSRRFMAAAKDNAAGGMKLGPPPVGYMTSDQPGRYVEDTVGAKYRKPSGPVVREVFRRYAADEPLCELTRWFNAELGLKRPHGEIRRLLKNPYYRGLNINCRMQDSDVFGKEARPDDYVEWNYHPNALCDEETWSKVEARLQREKRIGQQRDRGPRHPLTGLVHCARCQRRMAFHTKRARAEWRCDVCHAARSESKLFLILERELRDIIWSADHVGDILMQRAAEQRQTIERELADVEARITRLTKLRKGYQDMRALDELSGPEYMERIRESDREWEELQARREAIARRLAQRGDTPGELADLRRLMNKLQRQLEHIEYLRSSEVRAVYLRLLEAIRIDPDASRVTIEWTPAAVLYNDYPVSLWGCPAGRHAVPAKLDESGEEVDIRDVPPDQYTWDAALP